MSLHSTKNSNGTASRPIMAVLATTLIMASLIAGASPASAEHSICKRYYQFVPMELTAHDIEDWWPDNWDEITLHYPGRTYSTSIANGETRYEWQMPASPIYAQVPNSTFYVTLQEWDGDRARNLGTKSVTWTGHQGGLSFFAAGDYSYTLKYRVVDHGSAGCVKYVYVPNMEWHDEAYAVDVLDDNFRVVKQYVDDCLDPGIVRYQDPKDVERPQWSDVTIRIGACSSGYPK